MAVVNGQVVREYFHQDSVLAFAETMKAWFGDDDA